MCIRDSFHTAPIRLRLPTCAPSARCTLYTFALTGVKVSRPGNGPAGVLVAGVDEGMDDSVKRAFLYAKLTSSPRGISASSYKKRSVLGLKCRDFLLERRQVVLNGLSHDGQIHREITVRQ